MEDFATYKRRHVSIHLIYVGQLVIVYHRLHHLHITMRYFYPQVKNELKINIIIICCHIMHYALTGASLLLCFIQSNGNTKNYLLSMKRPSHLRQKKIIFQEGYRCICEWGYRSTTNTSNPYCEDVDECSANPCFPGSACINVPGSFIYILLYKQLTIETS